MAINTGEVFETSTVTRLRRREARAAIGGVAGGEKGAAIGALIGGGGAAVYTYRIRKRRRSARRY